MCNLYTLDPVLTELAEAFDKFLGRRLHLSAGAGTLANQPWKTSVWPRYQGLFMRPLDAADPTADLEPAVGRCGLVPSMHKGPAKDWKSNTNNCRSEEMHAKPSFRDALKEKRCIIPATRLAAVPGRPLVTPRLGRRDHRELHHADAGGARRGRHAPVP